MRLHTLLLTCARVGRLAPPCASMGSAASSRIEVERKFAAPEGGIAAGALAAGAELVGEARFSDEYWDTAQCDLTRTDTWLRLRRLQAEPKGQWELKLPMGADSKRSGGERTVFTEVEGEDAVRKELIRLLPKRLGGGKGTDSLDEMLRDAGLTPFASFETVRTKLRIHGVAIDADEASFGHSVVEVEVMCDSEDQVPAAEVRIAQVASAMGLQSLDGGSGGKLETYIRRFCPEVFNNLVEAGILRT